MRIKESYCPDNLKATKCPVIRKTTDCSTAPSLAVCVGFTPVLRICNSNGVPDDYFKIYIDGIFITDFNITTYTTTELRMMPASAAGKTIANLVGTSCTIFIDVYTSVLDGLAPGDHTLFMDYISPNGSGSFGVANMLCSSQDATTLTFESVGANFTYTGSNDQTFVFRI